MFELSPERFVVARPLFKHWLPRCAPAHAVLSGHNPGRVYVDDVDQPSVAFMWTRWGYYYLAGEPGNAAFNAALAERLARDFVPLSAATGELGLILYPSPHAWEEQVGTLLGTWMPVRIFRRTYAFHPERFAAYRAQAAAMPARFTVRAIDGALLASARPEISAALVAELGPGWASLEDFLARGIGSCVVDGDPQTDGVVASVCLTVMVSERAAEISVHTADAYLRRGLASHAAAACIEQCLGRGLVPNWECWWDNAASDALARRLGFEAVSDHPVYYWEAAATA